MRSSKLIHVVSCHAEGEVGNVIVGGVSPPPGNSLWEQARWIAEDDALRRFVLNEPRGGVFKHVNLLLPSKHPEADYGFIVMEPELTPPMSGFNSICVATVLLDTGLVEMREPVTEFRLEAPGGLVDVRAQCENGKTRSVQIRNVASFAGRLDAVLEVEGLGTLRVDTAYGGDSFVIVEAQALGFTLSPDEAADLAQTGARVSAAANEQIGFSHPENSDWRHISFCQFAMPIERQGESLVSRNTVSIDPGKLDRSPCGTGCSARMAVLHARGMMKVGDTLIGRSIIGSRFDCRIEAETRVGECSAVLPSVRGRAWITGTHQLMLDPDDPWPGGYRLSDTWPLMNRRKSG